MNSYRVGSIIEYSTFGGGIRRVEVKAKHDEIKNGEPGFDGTLVEAGNVEFPDVWGYDDQIQRVVKF